MSVGATPLREVQRAVALRMAVAAGLAVVGLTLAATLGRPAPVSERIEAAIVAAGVAAGWLAASIANVARLRFFSEHDIAGSAGNTASPSVAIGVAVVQNTLEQVVLAISVYAAVAFTMDRGKAVLLMLACCFSIGRALFWHGYPGGAQGRALGFAMTFYPNVGALLMAGATLIARSG